MLTTGSWVWFGSGFDLFVGSDLVLMSSLVHMYLKCNRIDDVHKLFDSMCDRDVIVWSVMIARYLRLGNVDREEEVFCEMRKEGVEPNLVSWNGMNVGFGNVGLYNEAVRLFREMVSEGFLPDGSTVSFFLPGVGNLEDVLMGKQAHGYVIKLGLESDKFFVSALLDMYGKCGCALEMFRVFDEIDQTEIGSLNAFLTRLSCNGLVDTALFNGFNNLLQRNKQHNL